MLAVGSLGHGVPYDFNTKCPLRIGGLIGD
jgi:hypothetical protein